MEAMERWKAAAGELTGEGRGKRYPQAMRRAAVTLAEEAAARGMRQAEVCRRLGVPDVTLKAWSRRREFVRVEVVEDTPECVRVVMGGGYAEMTLDQLAGVLRRLS